MFVEHKEQGETVPVKVGTLKLSEAIRIGAAMRRQCTGAWWVGAAWEGLYGYGSRIPPVPGDHDNSLMDALGAPHGLLSEITRRNDHGETREQIADWLESQGY